MSANELEAGTAPPESADANERLKFVLESAGLGTWEWDCVANAPVRMQNWGSVLDYASDTLPDGAESFGALIHPDDQARVAAAFADHLAGKTPRYLVDHRIRTAGGDWHWVRARGKLVSRMADGRPLHVIGTSEDITEQKRAEEDQRFLASLFADLLTLHEPDEIIATALAKLGAHLDAARVLIAEADDDSDHISVNWEWKKEAMPSVIGSWPIASFDPDFVAAVSLGNPLAIADVRQNAEIARSAILDAYRTANTVSILNTPLRADGRLRAMLVAQDSRPRDWQSREIALVGNVASRLWDAVMRARAELEHHSARELLEVALNLAQLGAFERDFLTGRQRMSDGLLALLGQPETTSDPLDDYLKIIHPDDAAEFSRKEKAGRAPDSSGLTVDEHRIITPGGDIRHIAFRRRTFFDETPDGPRLSHACTVLRDVTEEHRRSAETERTRERAQRISRLTAMGTMASTLAHELNQPLTAAANYLYALRAIQASGEAPPDVDPSDVLARALAKVLESGQIIKHIRSLSNEAPQMRSVQDVATLVEEAQAQLAERIPAGRVDIRCKLPAGLQVRVDAIQMEQVIFNLLRNAAEAMHGQEDAHILITAEPPINGMVRLHIADNGPGMSEEMAAELFNPFRPDHHGGTGLGLSLCRTMVEAHGGHISLEDHGEKGAHFLITLPGA